MSWSFYCPSSCYWPADGYYYCWSSKAALDSHPHDSCIDGKTCCSESCGVNTRVSFGFCACPPKPTPPKGYGFTTRCPPSITWEYSQCDADHYQGTNGYDNIEYCMPCSYGLTAPVGSTGISSCCPIGSIFDGTKCTEVQCPTNNFLLSGTCTPCSLDVPAGYFISGGCNGNIDSIFSQCPSDAYSIGGKGSTCINCASGISDSTRTFCINNDWTSTSTDSPSTTANNKKCPFENSGRRSLESDTNPSSSPYVYISIKTNVSAEIQLPSGFDLSQFQIPWGPFDNDIIPLLNSNGPISNQRHLSQTCLKYGEFCLMKSAFLTAAGGAAIASGGLLVPLVGTLVEYKALKYAFNCIGNLINCYFPPQDNPSDRLLFISDNNNYTLKSNTNVTLWFEYKFLTTQDNVDAFDEVNSLFTIKKALPFDQAYPSFNSALNTIGVNVIYNISMSEATTTNVINPTTAPSSFFGYLISIFKFVMSNPMYLYGSIGILALFLCCCCICICACNNNRKKYNIPNNNIEMMVVKSNPINNNNINKQWIN